MKKIKKLVLRSGQELSTKQQGNVFAAGDDGWEGLCNCPSVGRSHMETKSGIGYKIEEQEISISCAGFYSLPDGTNIYTNSSVYCYSCVVKEIPITFWRTRQLTRLFPTKLHSTIAEGIDRPN